MTNTENLFKIANADTDTAALHKEWDDALCPICMDHPHNAVLLLCSSHDKGCRSYICDTSYRHSNCLDRFKKMKVNDGESSSHPSSSVPGGTRNQNAVQRSRFGLTRESPGLLIDISEPNEASNRQDAIAGEQEENNYNEGPDLTLEAQEVTSGPLESNDVSSSNQLLCPLCRGTVSGWKIIKEARQYLDEKPRACSREACTFSGNYREIRRHARRVHPTTRPADVDPSRRRAWHRLEHQREYGDIVSAIRSAMPGAVVFGDYAIEGGEMFSHDRETSGPSEPSGSLLTTFFLFHMLSSSPIRSGDEPRGASRGLRRQRRRYLWGENLLGLQYDDDDEQEDEEEHDLDEEVQRPRSRRRFIRSRSEERA
ncbi:hypothetical protein GQ55_7G026200 [Panicum hallii var. hallii]|uniref:Uncharacterized protein n=1 Tax=Panicum hallii var. hallii TaxID=1504633 RepID=A0A2T7CS38_9POAL|nr:hypothetical protein GQ55_7G026200 [Panicum hallii var. hallii]